MVNGFYHRMKKRQIIYINKWISNIQMKVVCAHELGHAVLHDSNNACLGLEINAQLELEADVFKCALFRWGDFGNELRMFMVDEIIEFAGLLPNSYILDF
jgi:hypothetical protein